MYPPHSTPTGASQYSRLPSDPETADDAHHHLLYNEKSVPWKDRLRPRLRLAHILRLLLITGSCVAGFFVLRRLILGPPPPVQYFDWDVQARPPWLDAKLERPMKLRVAVISKFDEFARRQDMRDAVFSGVRRDEVQMDIKFIVGRPTGFLVSWWGSAERLEEEMKEKGDVILLEDIEDSKARLGEKRWAAIKWGGSVSPDTYDWFLNLDSDTFVRFGALARRTEALVKEQSLVPQNQSIVIGRMNRKDIYFENVVPDGDAYARDEDLFLTGSSSYDYPMGIGYMMSPFLVETLISLSPAPPHHIHYPHDDIMIGGWLAALERFPDNKTTFETLPTRQHSRRPIRKYVPAPYMKEPLKTLLINERETWHNYQGRWPGFDAAFSYGSVCVHHVSGEEMRTFREIEEITGEWED